MVKLIKKKESRSPSSLTDAKFIEAESINTHRGIIFSSPRGHPRLFPKRRYRKKLTEKQLKLKKFLVKKVSPEQKKIILDILNRPR